MNRHIASLLVFVSLLLPVQSVFAGQEPGEGYALPTFKELVQTMVLMNGFDISDPKIADEYGRIVYCSLYLKNFSNDVVWSGIRSQIVSRAQKRKEYFRVKYEIVSPFNLGRYDIKNQFFPISADTAITNVGSINLFAPEDHHSDCSGRDLISFFPSNVVLELSQPLTVNGFNIAPDKVEKMAVRMGEAGNTDRRIYGRIRVTVTAAEKGIGVSKGNLKQMALKGDITAIDFFLDPELTKPIGSVQTGHGQL